MLIWLLMLGRCLAACGVKPIEYQTNLTASHAVVANSTGEGDHAHTWVFDVPDLIEEDTSLINPSILPSDMHYQVFRATTDFVCVQDAELEKLVHTNGTRVRMYMFYHNSRTELIAKRYAFCKDWIVPHRLRRSPYFESQVYKFLFRGKINEMIKNYDYIFTCTYRQAIAEELQTSAVHALTTARMAEYIRYAAANDYDVVPLETKPVQVILHTLRQSHGPYSIIAWNILLIQMGFDMPQLSSATNINGFWRSSYIIKPVMLKRLTRLMLKAQDLVDHDEACIKAFKRDAVYSKGDPIVAKQVFGTPYYQMHPFIFERLPAFFLTALNASVPGLVTEKYQRPFFSSNVTLDNIMDEIKVKPAKAAVVPVVASE